MSGAFLTSCGDDAPSTDPAYYTPGGYWTGSLNGELGVALVDETGDFTFIAVDGEQYYGTLVITEPSDEPQAPYSALFTGTAEGFTTGRFPSYGTYTGTGAISGTMVPRQSIDGSAGSATISLTFNALYYMPSSLATISGTYEDTASGAQFTINADGTVFAQDATTGCVINGTVSIINGSYNAYGIQVSYANCAGSSAPLNGLTFAGLAALDNTKGPEQLLAGVWTSGPPTLSVTYTLVRM